MEEEGVERLLRQCGLWEGTPHPADEETDAQRRTLDRQSLVFPAQPPGALGEPLCLAGSPLAVQATPILGSASPPLGAGSSGWEGGSVFMERLNLSACPKEAEGPTV